jgi:predicted GNAT superfamily acetyltransferase
MKAESHIDVPAEIYEWKAAKNPRAAQVQSRNRELFLKYFKSGLAVLGYERNDSGVGRFLLGHWDEKLGY